MEKAIIFICWLGLALMAKSIFNENIVDFIIGCFAFFGGLAFHDEVE